MPSERTPLTQTSTPNYVFLTNRDREYRRRVRRMQCCICAGILAILLTALVITVSYAVDGSDDDANNTTDTPPPNTTLPNLTLSSVHMPLLTLSWPLKEKLSPTWGEEVNATEIESALSYGRQCLYEKELFEEKVFSLPIDSPSFRHRVAISTSPEAREMARVGFIMEAATRRLTERYGEKKPIGRSKVYELDLLPKEMCSPHAPKLKCEKSRFRTYDGSCNNLLHPRTWGARMRPFRRLLPPQYADGVSMPRKAVDGSLLPSAREVSLHVHRALYEDDPNFTVMLAVWGQFLDHDITATASSQGNYGEPVSCCYGFLQAGLRTHKECYTVRIGGDDPFFSQKNVTCLEFVRSAPSPVCSFGPREQMNQASAYIDGSVVYGRTETEAISLRTLEGGLMKTLTTPEGIQVLPISTDSTDGCNHEEELARGRYCFVTGDARANENIHLTTMHLLWVRQHNILAEKLDEINPQWDDERLYQEARRIIGAQMQHIHYNEFLPVVLGRPLMDELNLSPKKEGYSDIYDPDVDATIGNEFATAAYRFGHTLLPRLFRATAKDNSSSEEYIEMHKMLFNPFRLYDKDFIENAVRGALETPIKKQDSNVDGQFTEHLFEREAESKMREIPQPEWRRNVNAALDLVALNVQRGRDHALAGYPEWRQLCGLSRPTSFDDLAPYMANDSIAEMKTIYKSVDDIDMYTGAVTEKPIPGSFVGQTIMCILTDQFVRLQRGDRYWYESSQGPYPFTPEQLNSIRGTTLAKIICDTSGVDEAQRMVMERKGPGNEKEKCVDLPGLDLNAWKDLAGGGNATPSPELPVQEPRATAPTTGPPTLIKLGGRVISASAVIQGVPLFSGFPVKLPMRGLDAVVQTAEPFDQFYPPVFANGIAWKGKVGLTNKEAKLSGKVSIPQYVHSPGTVKINWFSGDVTLDLTLNWTNTEIESINLEGEYSSHIYLKNDEKYAYLRNSTNTDLTSTLIPSSTPEQSNTGLAAPVILIGVYSQDKEYFFWEGEVTMTLPNRPATEIVLTSVKTVVRAYNPKRYIVRNKIGGNVRAGKITGHGSTIWNGQLPVSIPVNSLASWALADDTHQEPQLFWQGSYFTDTPGTATISGHVLYPKTEIKNGTLIKNWYEGDATIDLDVAWSLKEGPDYINGQFITPVYFEDRTQYEYLKDVPTTSFEVLNESSTEGRPAQSGLTAPLILIGTYSKDMKEFIWNGNLTLILPEELQDPGQRVSFRVVGGDVSVEGTTVWTNDLPLVLPAAFLNGATPPVDTSSLMSLPYGNGMLWNGSVIPMNSQFTKIQGNFSIPSASQGNELSSAASWINGALNVRVQTNETIELSGPYLSPIYSSETITSVADQELNKTNDFSSGTPTNKPSVNRSTKRPILAPLILHGIYSLDKANFLWNGECDLILPSPPTSSKPTIFTNAQLEPADAAAEVVDAEDSFKLIGFVQKSEITVEGKPLPPTNFSVAALAIPLASMGSVATSDAQPHPISAYAQGILWSGKSEINPDQSVTVSGNFSLPFLANHITSWYNGKFSFVVKPIPGEIIVPFNNIFSTTVYFKESYTGLAENNTISGFKDIGGSSSPAVTPGVMGSAPTILYGHFSPENSVFLWSGKLAIIIPRPQVKAQKPIKRTQMSVQGFVSSGSVNVGGVSVWEGNRVPLSVPFSHFDGLGIGNPFIFNWLGEITTIDIATARLKGGFSIQTKLTKEWYNTEFELELKSSLPLSIMNMNGSYITKLYLLEGFSATTELVSPEWALPLPDQMITSTTATHLVKNVVSSEFAIFFHGSFSTDRQNFICTGNATIMIPIDK